MASQNRERAVDIEACPSDTVRNTDDVLEFYSNVFVLS